MAYPSSISEKPCPEAKGIYLSSGQVSSAVSAGVGAAVGAAAEDSAAVVSATAVSGIEVSAVLLQDAVRHSAKHISTDIDFLNIRDPPVQEYSTLLRCALWCNIVIICIR